MLFFDRAFDRARMTFRKSLAHLMVVCLGATLLAGVALVVGASSASATATTICSGETIQLRPTYDSFYPNSGPDQPMVTVMVPAGATATMSGTILTNEAGTWTNDLYFSRGSDADYAVGQFSGSGPSALSFSLAPTAWKNTQSIPWGLSMEIFQQHNLNVVVNLTLTVSGTAATCDHAVSPGKILGGHDQSRPLVCECGGADPVSVQTGNFYDTFTFRASIETLRAPRKSSSSGDRD